MTLCKRQEYYTYWFALAIAQSLTCWAQDVVFVCTFAKYFLLVPSVAAACTDDHLYCFPFRIARTLQYCPRDVVFVCTFEKILPSANVCCCCMHCCRIAPTGGERKTPSPVKTKGRPQRCELALWALSSGPTLQTPCRARTPGTSRPIVDPRCPAPSPSLQPRGPVRPRCPQCRRGS